MGKMDDLIGRYRTSPNQKEHRHVCEICDLIYVSFKKEQKFCSKKCAFKYAGSASARKTRKCSTCGIAKRLFDFNQGKEDFEVCISCLHRKRYLGEGLVPPLDVVASIREARGTGKTIDYMWFLNKFGLSLQKTYKLVADLVTDGYLLGMGHGRFVLGDTVETMR